MKVARLRVRVIEKATRRTWFAVGFDDGVFLCMATGTKRLVQYAGGYGEYNDRGEPVLDSWFEPLPRVVLA